MQLYRTLDALRAHSDAGPRSVAIGVFDGLHLGHRAIIEQAQRIGAATGAKTLVFSFEPTPKEFFAPATAPPRLTRFRERFELLELLGVDEHFCPYFGAIRNLAPEVFVDELLAGALHATHVVVGDDFRFGAGRRGDLADLREGASRHGFTLSRVAPVYWGAERVSSTAIRAALQSGDLAAARCMLGRDYSISGRVVRGLGLGRELGFPTANVNLKRLQAPVDGIFAARVTGLGPEALDGVASVGTRPTIGGNHALLEVFIFDYDRDIYGEYITVHFVERLREERHYPDLDALRRQIGADVAAAKAALSD